MAAISNYEREKMRKRISAISGDGKENLGKGWYVGNVNVYSFRDFSTMSLHTLSNAEQRPSDQLIEAQSALGRELDILENNPKLVMDNGEVYYGCQVWWEEIDE